MSILGKANSDEQLDFALKTLKIGGTNPSEAEGRSGRKDMQRAEVSQVEKRKSVKKRDETSSWLRESNHIDGL